MARPPIRIMTTDFELVNEVSGYSSLSFNRSWHGVGKMTIVINRHVNNNEAKDLQQGRLIFPAARYDCVYVIEDRSIKLDENGKESEDWEITAHEVKFPATNRTTLPPDGFDQDEYRGPAETAMYQFFTNNIINPLNGRTERIIPNIVAATDLGRGIESFFQTRFDNLQELLTEISLFSGLGWVVRYDPGLNKLVYEVLEGNDRTTSQSTLPPAIFAPDFDTVAEMEYQNLRTGYKNVAIVAGPGEGKDRLMAEAGFFTGWDRREVFIDARDIPTETEDDPPVPRPEPDIIDDMFERGRQKLAEMQQELFVKCEALNAGNMTYRVDFDLGDLVTIRNREWGITLDARITDIVETYEENDERIELTYDNSIPTLTDKVRKRIDNVSVESKR